MTIDNSTIDDSPMIFRIKISFIEFKKKDKVH